MAEKETSRQRKEREKAFRKESQKIAIQAVGRNSVQESTSDKDSIQRRGKETINEARTVISSTGSSLQKSVKGQFGDKVSEVFEEQKKMLQELQ